MTTPTLSRSQRAMRLCMQTQKSWTVAHIGIMIPSQTKPNVRYQTTLDGCTCADHSYRLIVCKHMLAARIFMGRNAS